MRMIVFKGVYEGRWISGDLLHENGKMLIKNASGIFEVDPETISEFTGMTDCTEWDDLEPDEKAMFEQDFDIKAIEEEWDGIPIYTNDIMVCDNIFNPELSFTGIVAFVDGCFGVAYNDGEDFISFSDLMEYKFVLVGNVFEVDEEE